MPTPSDRDEDHSKRNGCAAASAAPLDQSTIVFCSSWNFRAGITSAGDTGSPAMWGFSAALICILGLVTLATRAVFGLQLPKQDPPPMRAVTTCFRQPLGGDMWRERRIRH
jgi:hypothetical protein